MKPTTLVIHHSADFDGIMCREIARHFLPHAKLVGWDFKDEKIPVPESGPIFIMDLSPDCLADNPKSSDPFWKRIVWIDHHATSIAKWPSTIPGYRIDGVAACRLAWQYFSIGPDPAKEPYPEKQDYIDHIVSEPWGVCLAGEYDVWDRRDPNAALFNSGLTANNLSIEEWEDILDNSQPIVSRILHDGVIFSRGMKNLDADIMLKRSCIIGWEGLKFLALNSARCNSNTFASMDHTVMGHDALMGFYWCDGKWTVSLYHANHNKELDLSAIAKKYGGGGHKGACGMTFHYLPPFLTTGTMENPGSSHV